MPFIFIDESGQFTKRDHEQYFIVSSFTVGDPRRTEKRFRGWYRSKFPRRIRTQSEIKFSEVNIDNALRLRTLKYIADLDVRIRYSYLLRNNIPNNFKHKGKLETGFLYKSIITETLEMYLPIDEKEFRVFCDQRHLKGLSNSQFCNLLRTHLLPLLPKDSLVQIEMIDSTTNANIQIADWIAGALARYYEHKPLGEECFRILKNNILGEGRELFRSPDLGK